MRRYRTLGPFLATIAFFSLQASALATPSYQVTVQPIFVTGSSVDQNRLDTDIQYASTIFNQIGVDLIVLPSIASSAPSNMSNFLLYSYNTGGRNDIIPVWFVNTIYSSTSYRGLSLGGSVWVSDYQVWDTLAHELAHVLTGFYAVVSPDPADTAHSLDPNNLLAGGNIRQVPTSLASIGTVDQLTQSQLAQMVKTGRIVAAPTVATADTTVPEPGTTALAGVSLIVLSLVFRKKSRRR